MLRPGPIGLAATLNGRKQAERHERETRIVVKAITYLLRPLETTKIPICGDTTKC
jgi:hypothetical protein